MTIDDGGEYSVKVSSPVSSEVASAIVTIGSLPVLKITSQPVPLTLNEGVSGQLSVVASITPAQTLTYQWYKDGAVVTGATTDKLNIAGTGVARAGSYYVKILSSMAPVQTVKSNTVKVRANRTYDVQSITGCVNGYCKCVTMNQINVPDRAKAAAICAFKGYADVTTFTTVQGPLNQRQCEADGSNCFVNGNLGNIVCASVSCTK